MWDSGSPVTPYSHFHHRNTKATLRIPCGTGSMSGEEEGVVRFPANWFYKLQFLRVWQGSWSLHGETWGREPNSFSYSKPHVCL